MDDLKDFHPLDPGRVSILSESSYWCVVMHCTKAELEDAVAKVGDHVAAVRQEFQSRGNKSST